MYHSLKRKEIKPPRGWQFSGERCLLILSNNNSNIYFRVINTSVEGYRITGIPTEIDEDNWEVIEYHAQTGIRINRGRALSNKEAKELAVKLAKNLNTTKFRNKLFWVAVGAFLGVFLGVLGSLILQKLLDQN